MIVIKLYGGLGNQMFQYSIGCTLAVKNKTELKFDVSWFNYVKDTTTHREYGLNIFNIIENIATQKEIDKMQKCRKIPGRRHFLHNFFIANNSIYIKEKQFNFNPEILKISNNAYLDGYWQSEKYFKNIENVIRKKFTLKNKFQIKNIELKEKIKNSNSVSIHIRRGDYAKNLKTKSYHGLCPLDYYYQAILNVIDKVTDPILFIFSDDIKWCKENLKIQSPTNFIEKNKDYEDLILMSLCKHNIIANSSFSWWGAWLNSNPNKIVIVPKKWFNDPNKNTKDLIPKSWTKI